MRCAYVRHLWDCGETIEIEEKHTGRYGARGQKREKRKKASPEDIKRQNKWKRERDLRRLIKWNFGKYDYWMTITYRKGDRPALIFAYSTTRVTQIVLPGNHPYALYRSLSTDSNTWLEWKTIK